MYNQDQNQDSLSIVGKSSLPGNLGFDPLHLATTRRQLVTYRAAEIKHARLAMLVSYVASGYSVWSVMACHG